MKHASVQAIWQIWTGYDAPNRPQANWGGIPVGLNACTMQPGDTSLIGGHDIFDNIPTCPRCAVLYDEAMTAREELLGRAAA